MEYVLTILVFYFGAASSLAIKRHKHYPLVEDVNCGATPVINVKPYIIDGKYAFFGEYPWFARIFISIKLENGTEMSWGCGGSIINIKYILTAAACMLLLGEPPDTSKLKVVLGDLNSTTNPDCEGLKCAPPPQNMSVEKVVYPKDYRWGQADHPDLSLLKLKTLIKYNGFVRPVCLPFDFVDEPKEKLDDVLMKDHWRCCKFAGWGAFTKKGKEILDDPPTRLKSASIPVVQCPRENRGKAFICGEGGTGNPCFGDAGGPLTIRTPRGDGYLTHTLVGLPAFQFGPCNRLTTLTYFTNVTKYLEWILDNVEP